MKDSQVKYKIVLTILGQEWKTKGNSILEALQAFNLDWHDIKGKGTLAVSCGSKTHEHLMTMSLLRRIFASKIVMVHWAKNLEYLLN